MKVTVSVGGRFHAFNLAAELARGHALDVQEAAVEVGDVVETHLVGNTGDLPV